MAKANAPRNGWKSRIVGEYEVSPDQLLAHPLNARRHPASQRDALDASLDSLGWIQRVVVNRRTGHVIDGHARVEQALSHGAATVPVLEVDLSEDEERLALAVFDPISALATYDQEMLAELLESVAVDDAALVGMLNDISATFEESELSENYSRKIEAPIYEVTGECPSVSALVDDAKTQELKAEILAADLPADVRAFLLSAAERHTVFNFRNIAEFYAHADADVQRLMERSALVIIDFDRAIEEGFVSLALGMMEQAEASKEANYA